MSRKNPSGGNLRVAFRTQGCRLNQVDTESMKTTLSGRGDISLVAWGEDADVYVLNSCTVTGRADQECRRLARQTKRRSPGCKVVVAGCYAQTQPDVLRGIPEIDAIIGNTGKENAGKWLQALLEAEDCLVDVHPFSPGSGFDAPLIEDFEGRTRAFIKVQDGCECRCSYCQIWKARGPSRSRRIPEILDQLRLLESRGFPEIVLAGIHLGLYGQDLQQHPGLIALLQEVLEAMPNLRLRLSSIHPDEVNAELLRLFSVYPNLRPHLHISLQSASGAVLQRMRRLYTPEQADSAFRAAASTLPHFGIGADVIVGFPGETDEEFQETMNFVERHAFSYLHVFRYSPRPGTEAATLPQVMPEIVSNRGRLLRQLASEKKLTFLKSLLGITREAVVEAEDLATGLRQATTDNYVTVLLPPDHEPGTIVDVRPTEFADGRLFAEVERVVVERQGD